MRRTVFASLLWAVSMGCWAGDESAFRLELASPARTLRLGQTTQLKLAIIGSGVYAITEGTEGINADNMRAGSFVYQFEFKPQRTGRFVFGPYSLVVNGQKLESNRASVEVLPQWDGKLGTYFRVDATSIVLGEDVELTVESWASTYESRSMNLGRQDSFTWRSGGASSFSSRSDKDGNVCYTKKAWLISPTKAGEFKIDRTVFTDFPQDVTPPDFTITVKEPAQPPARSDEKPTPQP
jgi:hypothetical protein